MQKTKVKTQNTKVKMQIGAGAEIRLFSALNPREPGNPEPSADFGLWTLDLNAAPLGFGRLLDDSLERVEVVVFEKEAHSP